MKININWNYKKGEELPLGKLPENAVKFKEPNTPKELSESVLRYTFISMAIIVALFMMSIIFIKEEFHIDRYILFGILASVLTIVPHEFLHGICFKKDSVINIYFALKMGLAFVLCNDPISKRRFVFLSLFPNLVFGIIPYIIWVFLPQYSNTTSFLLGFSYVCILFGVGDYLNVVNAIRQMPKGSFQQLSGFNSFWFVKGE